MNDPTRGPAIAATLTAAAVIALVAGCSFSDGAGAAAAPRSPCFVLPGAGASTTQSYRVLPGGAVERTGAATGGAHHMRAAFHPDGRTLYINDVGPEGWPVASGEPAEPGVRVRAYAYDPEDCRVGEFLGSADMGSDAPNGERAYGLIVDPRGRHLYQTTASLQRIRLYDLDERGVPVPRADYDVTGAGAHVCAQTRRFLLHPDRRVLYANCNNWGAGDVDQALQVWRVEDDGALALLEHHTLTAMNGGVFDPVLHPSGDWVYHPIGTVSAAAPRGNGGYVLIHRVAPDGRLTLHDQVPIGTIAASDSVADPTNVPIWPITFSLHPDGTHAYISLHTILNRQAADADSIEYVFPHELVVYDVLDGGARLVERSRFPALRETRFSSHHGGTVVATDDELYYYSYLTDYDSIQGGVLQQLRIRADGSMVPLDPPWIATGLRNGRQVIALGRYCRNPGCVE